MHITPTDVTVCVVVKDRLRLMSACLDSLLNQSVAPAAFVIIDNGSTDGTHEMLESQAALNPRMTVLRDGGSLGHIRNLAVSTAQTAVVAFIDSDCTADSEWVAAIVSKWSASEDATLACVQGRTTPNPDHDRPWWSMTQNISSFSGRYEACNISYLRTALEQTSGFDERIGYLGEDSAAGWSLERRGYTATFAADAIVLHAITPVGLLGHVRRAARYGKLCRLIRLFPEKRAGLVNGVFLTRRTRLAWILLTGLLLTLIGALVPAEGLLVCGSALILLWLLLTWRSLGDRSGAVKAVSGRAIVDLTMVTSLAIGSLRHRCVVL